MFYELFHTSRQCSNITVRRSVAFSSAILGPCFHLCVLLMVTFHSLHLSFPATQVVDVIEYLKRPERLGLGAQPQADPSKAAADAKKVVKMGACMLCSDG